jgi:hypothetical protein
MIGQTATKARDVKQFLQIKNSIAFGGLNIDMQPAK